MTNNVQIAKTIASQIPTSAKMWVGYHQPVAIDSGLRFKVGGRRQTWVEITLDWTDTYTVELVKWHRTKGRVIVKSTAGIYCDQLGTAVETAYAAK